MTGFSEMDRRAMLQRALALVGATASGAVAAPALAGAVQNAGPFLDQAQFSLLSAVADTMVPETDTPGAVAATVPASVDGLLRDWASPERREMLTAALAAIDAAALAQAGKGFAALPPDQRKTLLTKYDIAALKPLPAPPVASGGLRSLMAGAAVADPGYAKLKELIVLLYYMSEIGLTRELSYEHAPGAWKPSIPVTPQTRPQGGTSY